MHFAKTAFLLASAVATVLAQSATFTAMPTQAVAAGSSVPLTWSGAQSVTIDLLDFSDQNFPKVVASYTGTGGSGTFQIPQGVGSYPLAFSITAPGDAQPNYSAKFSATGGTDTISGSASASAGTASITASGSSTATGSSSAAASTTLSVSSSASSAAASSSSASASSASSSSSASSKSSASSASKTSSASAAATSTSAPNPNSAPSFSSPLAFILSIFAAVIYLH